MPICTAYLFEGEKQIEIKKEVILMGLFIFLVVVAIIASVTMAVDLKEWTVGLIMACIFTICIALIMWGIFGPLSVVVCNTLP